MGSLFAAVDALLQLMEVGKVSGVPDFPET